MINPIQLEIIEPQPQPEPVAPPVMATSQITTEQVQALIQLIASADPAVIILPEGKQFADIKAFQVIVLPNEKGVVHIRF
jgi:hypothetical protein